MQHLKIIRCSAESQGKRLAINKSANWSFPGGYIGFDLRQFVNIFLDIKTHLKVVS